MYILTAEGKRYLKHGLPERRLMAMLRKPAELNKLRSREDFSIAIQWAKKKGWVKIERGVVTPVAISASFPEEETLRRVNNGKKVDRTALKNLLRRRLVVELREDFRKRAEKQLNAGTTTLTPELITTGLWKKATFKPYNVAAVGRMLHTGRRHPYAAFLIDARRKLVELGFREMSGPLIETEFWNFDALYQAQNHPSRDWTETYSLRFPQTGALPSKSLVSRVRAAHENGWTTGSSGWGYRWDPKKAAKLMPRAHGTAISARTLAGRPVVPGKYFAIARCFRPDVVDATHGVEFNQTEGIVVDESLNLTNLLGILKSFAKEFAGADTVKFFPDYYPFVEPGVQLSAKHPQLGWIEFGGAGIFREELTRPLGIEQPVIAWGIGIDRIAMFKLGISDIRQLFSKDLKWLRETRVM